MDNWKIVDNCLMQILVDTNFLLRSVQDSHPQQVIALAASEQCSSSGHRLVIVPQVLYEFWVVATRPASQNGLDWTVEETRLKIVEFLDFLTLLRDERAVFDPWFGLVTHYKVKGKNAHDARLVAAMERHGLEYILTFNTKDFERYQGVLAIQPENLLDGSVSLNAAGR